MARINFPNTFAGVVKLFRAVKKKYDAEAGASKLQPFLDEDDIDMDVDETAVDAAVDANTAFEAAEKEAEKLVRDRDNKFNPTFVFLEGAVQFLKKLYHANVRKLGDWGITVDGENRINYPRDFEARQALVLVFIAKHNSFAAGTSPLQPYIDENDIDIIQLNGDATHALTDHTDFETQDALKEEKREERDNLIATVESHLRGEGQYLVNLYPNNPKKAGDWGFEVNDSAQEDKLRDVLLKEAEVKTIHDALLASVLTYNGPAAATIYPGKTVEGTGVTLNSGDTFIIKRGFGTFTIKNESNTQKVSFVFTENR